MRSKNESGGWKLIIGVPMIIECGRTKRWRDFVQNQKGASFFSRFLFNHFPFPTILHFSRALFMSLSAPLFSLILSPSRRGHFSRDSLGLHLSPFTLSSFSASFHPRLFRNISVFPLNASGTCIWKPHGKGSGRFALLSHKNTASPFNSIFREGN